MKPKASRGGRGGSSGQGRPQRGGGGGGGSPRRFESRDEGRARPESSVTQVEGRRAVTELLLARRRRVRDVWITEEAEPGSFDEIVEAAADLRVSVHYVSRARLYAEATTEAPQGVIAHAEKLPEVSFDSLLQSENGIAPFLMVLDGVTDPHNVGALIRSASCAGATGVVIPKRRAAHVTPTVAKASAGAIEHLPIATVPGVPAALSTCREAGIWTVGLSPDGDTDIYDVAVADQPVALVLGAEGEGLSRLTEQRCDVLARIPQQSDIASLNVSAAGAIALFEMARKRAQG